MNEYKEIEYKAKIQYEDGTTNYPVELIDFDENLLGEELWCYQYSARSTGVAKVNDTHIPEKDLYYLGYRKIIEIQKVETVTNETKIY